MGRWGDTLRAYTSSRDTADTVDTSPVERAGSGGSVRGVNSVNGSTMERSKAVPDGWPGEVSVVSAMSTACGTEIVSGPIDLGILPDVCGVCGQGAWWRASVLSGGPGPWRCSKCDPAPPEVWQDATAVPIARGTE